MRFMLRPKDAFLSALRERKDQMHMVELLLAVAGN